MRILLISILGLLTLASCTKQEPMEALIDRVFTVAVLMKSGRKPFTV